jgi:hypothetical protein
LPVTIIAALSLITPLFIARGVLLFLPYFIIVLCRGLASLVRLHPVWITLVLLLTVTHIFSIRHWQNRLHSPRDYKGLYEKWAPKIKPSDLIFIRRNWAMTPIFYYLKGSQYRFVGQNYSQEILKHPESRVWVLRLPGMNTVQELEDALAGYTPQDRVDAFNMWTVLYVKKPSIYY